MKAGVALEVPELPGRWSVWSKAADRPGAHFVVPLDDEAREYGVKYAVVVVAEKAEGRVVTCLRTDPHKFEPQPTKGHSREPAR